MPKPRPGRADRGQSVRNWLPLLVTPLLALALQAPARALAQDADDPARQVTLFGVIASPDDLTIDPKLARIRPQLRKLLPDHGFKLLDVQSKRLTEGQTISCDLEGRFTATATLSQALDENGKVELRCAVLQNQVTRLETRVTTPTNQLFFCEKALDNGTRLLIGIGAR
ncbi:MAG: hypothetical protein NVSMB9_14710 [Isosphaeraceae bacterium]